jgi:hypothetical protein
MSLLQCYKIAFKIPQTIDALKPAKLTPSFGKEKNYQVIETQTEVSTASLRLQVAYLMHDP